MVEGSANSGYKWLSAGQRRALGTSDFIAMPGEVGSERKVRHMRMFFLRVRRNCVVTSIDKVGVISLCSLGRLQFSVVVSLVVVAGGQKTIVRQRIALLFEIRRRDQRELGLCCINLVHFVVVFVDFCFDQVFVVVASAAVVANGTSREERQRHRFKHSMDPAKEPSWYESKRALLLLRECTILFQSKLDGCVQEGTNHHRRRCKTDEYKENHNST
mmetsp:Transcript_21748/g.40604  ORF Transcript_21748/g.40604 Transcript_21748/m.40604 type:complete len:216 (+) Transcript_21748:745-1392(+)